MDAAAEHLLDFSKPFDHKLLDQIVTIAMDGKHAQRAGANDFLVKIKDHPDMWKRVDAILQNSQVDSSKIFALQVLADVIDSRWKVIPVEQREGIRNFILSQIVSLCSKQVTPGEKLILNKLNFTLVAILKQDWPHNWPGFISELIDTSKASEALCENNMGILKLFSEEVFEYSVESMTGQKTRILKESLTNEFSKVFELCEAVLTSSKSISLVKSTLLTLQKFLVWIPLGYIFETSLISALITTFLPTTPFRIVTLDCLTEIASLPTTEICPKYSEVIFSFLGTFIDVLKNILPTDFDLANGFPSSSESDQLFVDRLALFLVTFLKSYYFVFEDASGQLISKDQVLTALGYLLMISRVNDDQIFKTCLEFWSYFSFEIYTKVSQNKDVSFGSNSSPMGRLFYLEGVIHELRIVMINHMAKPEEVIVVEDENGEIVRETTKDTEVIAQYKTMRDALIYLTHLHYDDTQFIMLDMLEKQVNYGEFTWNGLNTLCWAIGSISGAMGESDEKRFLVSVIKDLLHLCEEVRGKDNKAVVASNIMYIVGQYPRFLRAHWKFLKTVVNKLFEFMHEHHPGVQDMSCDTFLKIATKCKRKFMTVQLDEDMPFISTLISELPRHIADLQPHQVLSFYESVATMLSDVGPGISLMRSDVLLQLMEAPNSSWRYHLQQGAVDNSYLLSSNTTYDLLRILKINNRVCTAVGSLFIHQLSSIFLDAMQIYKFYSETIVNTAKKEGEVSLMYSFCKSLRAVKGEILDLLSSFFGVIGDLEGGPQSCLGIFLPSILDNVLPDYKNCPGPAREAKVLNMFASGIAAFKDSLSNYIPVIMESVFEPTLMLITSNMMDHPDHRIAFFKFLRNANEFCFYGLFSIPPDHQKLVIDSIIWAFKHTERNISETGLDILLELLKKVNENPSILGSFYQTFAPLLLNEVFGVLTDRLHKSGFQTQVLIIMTMVETVMAGTITEPIFTSGVFDSNAHFVRQHIFALLCQGFPNMAQSNVSRFVDGLFIPNASIIEFKDHFRDFLVESKEFSMEDNSDLYLAEKEAEAELARRELRQYRASVRGLLNSDELDDDNDVESKDNLDN